MASRQILVIARPQHPGARAVFEATRDWTLSGILQQSHWVDLDEPNTVIRLGASDQQVLDLTAWVAALGAGSTIEVYVLQPARDSKSLVDVDDVFKQFQNVGVIVSELPKLLNVVIPTSDGALPPLNPRVLNFLALPQDGFSPDGGSVPVTSKSSTYSQHAAKELASVAGLWSGQTEPGIRRTQPTNRYCVVLGRSFVRYVDASSLVTSVIDSILDEDFAVLPSPLDEASGQILDEVTGPSAVEQVRFAAEAFVEANKEKLSLSLARPKVPREQTKMGFLSALKLYFSWVWGWLLSQPKDILQKKIQEKKLKLASRVQSIFGPESEYAVYVGGVTAHPGQDGTQLDLPSLILETAEVQYATSGVANAVKPAPAPAGNLWQQMAEVAFSLADGGRTPSSALPLPSLQGGLRRVITNPNLITPNFESRSFDVPAHLNIGYAGQQLRSDDPLTARLVQDQMQRVLNSSTSISAAEAALLAEKLAQLEQWRKTNQSFVWSVGEAISNSIYDSLNLWQRFSDSAKSSADDTSLIEAEEKAQKTLKALFKGAVGIILTALLAWLAQALFFFFAFGAWPIMSSGWALPASVVAGLFALWNVVGFFALNGAIKELFQLRTKLDTAESRLKIAQEIKAKLWLEIYRLTSLYQQYQAWCSVLSRFVHRPSSRAGVAGKNTNLTSRSSALPTAMAIAKLNPDESSSTTLLSSVKNSFYRDGWIYQSFDEVVMAAGFDLTSLWGDGLATKNSPLSQLVGLSAKPELAQLLENTNKHQIHNLATRGTNYQKWSIQRVDSVGDVQNATGEEFMQELGRGLSQLPAQDLLSTDGVLSEAFKIDENSSSCSMDSRLSVESDFAQRKIQVNELGSRRLDFMGVRLELTELIPIEFTKSVSALDGVVETAEQEFTGVERPEA